jgi:hypothetical protein
LVVKEVVDRISMALDYRPKSGSLFEASAPLLLSTDRAIGLTFVVSNWRSMPRMHIPVANLVRFGSASHTGTTNQLGFRFAMRV